MLVDRLTLSTNALSVHTAAKRKWLQSHFPDELASRIQAVSDTPGPDGSEI